MLTVGSVARLRSTVFETVDSTTLQRAGAVDWTAANSWTPSGPPTATDTAVITNTHGFSLTANATVAQLEIQPAARLVLGAGVSLTVTGAMLVYGNSSTQCDVTGAGVQSSSLVVQSMTVSIPLAVFDLTLRVTGGSMAIGASTAVLDSAVVVSGGALQWSGNNVVITGTGTKFTLNGGFTGTATGATSTFSSNSITVSGGAFVQSGADSSISTTTMVLSSAVTNVSLSNGYLTAATLSSASSLVVTISGTGVVASTNCTVDGGLVVSSGSLSTPQLVAPAVTVSGGSVTVSASSTLSGALRLLGGSLSTAALSAPSVSVSAGSLTASSSSTLTGALNVSGTGTVQIGVLSADSVTITAGTVTATGGSTLTGALSVSGGGLSTTALSAASATITAGAVTASTSSTLAGALSVAGGSLSTAALTVDTVTVTAGSATVSGSATLTGALSVSGGALSTGTLNATSTVTCSGGSISASTGLQVSGALLVDSTGAVSCSACTTARFGNTVTVSGAGSTTVLSVVTSSSGSTVQLSSALSVTGPARVSFTGAGVLTADSAAPLRFNNGTESNLTLSAVISGGVTVDSGAVVAFGAGATFTAGPVNIGASGGARMRVLGGSYFQSGVSGITLGSADAVLEFVQDGSTVSTTLVYAPVTSASSASPATVLVSGGSVWFPSGTPAALTNGLRLSVMKGTLNLTTANPVQLGTVTVGGGSALAVGTLLLDGSGACQLGAVSVNAGSGLRISQPTTAASNLTLASGSSTTVAAGVALSLSGAVSCTGCFLNVLSGSTVALPSTAPATALSLASGGNVTVAGTLSGAVDLSLAGSSVLDVTATGAISLTADSSLLCSASSIRIRSTGSATSIILGASLQLSGASALSVLSGGQLTLGNSVNSNLTLTGTSALSVAGKLDLVARTVQLQGGASATTLQFLSGSSGSWTSSTVSIDRLGSATAVCDTVGSASIQLGNVTVSGLLQLQGSGAYATPFTVNTLQVSGSSGTPVARFNIPTVPVQVSALLLQDASSSVDLASGTDMQCQTLQWTGGTLTGTTDSVLAVTGGATLAGTLTLNSVALKLNGAASSVQSVTLACSAGSVYATGPVTWSGAGNTVTGTGSCLLNGTGSTITVDSGTLSLGNNVLLALQRTQMQTTGSGSGIVLTGTAAALVQSASTLATSTLTQSGTASLAVSSDSTLEIGADWSLSSSGTVGTVNGTLRWNGTGTVTGTLSVYSTLVAGLNADVSVSSSGTLTLDAASYAAGTRINITSFGSTRVVDAGGNLYVVGLAVRSGSAALAVAQSMGTLQLIGGSSTTRLYLAPLSAAAGTLSRTVVGTFRWTLGQLLGGSAVSAAYAVSSLQVLQSMQVLYGGLSSLQGVQLLLNGTGSWSSASSLVLRNGSAITVGSGGQLTISNTSLQLSSDGTAPSSQLTVLAQGSVVVPASSTVLVPLSVQSGGSVTVGSSGSGTLTVQNATLSCAGTGSALTAASLSLQMSNATVDTGCNATLSGALSLTGNTQLTVAGAVTGGPSTSVTVTSSTLTLQPGGSVLCAQFNASQATVLSSSSSGSGSDSISLRTTGSATLTAQSNVMLASVTTSLSVGTLLTVDAASSLTLAGSSSLSFGSGLAVQSGGSVRLSGSGNWSSGATASLLVGTLGANVSTVDIAGSATVARLANSVVIGSVGRLTYSAAGVLSSPSTGISSVDTSGALTLVSSAPTFALGTLMLRAGTCTLGAVGGISGAATLTGGVLALASDLAVSGGLSWQAGNITAGGDRTALLQVNGSTAVSTTSTKLATGVYVRNVGTLTLSSGILGANGTMLVNGPGATMSVLSALVLSDASGVGGGVGIVNEGTLTKDSVISTTVAVPVNNTGSIRVNSGTLLLSGTNTTTSGSGSWSLATLTVLTLNGGGHSFANGSQVTLDGAATATGGAAVTMAGALALSTQGSLTVTGTGTVFNLTDTSRLSSAGALTVGSAAVLQSSGYVAFSAQMTVTGSGSAVLLTRPAQCGALGTFTVQDESYLLLDGLVSASAAASSISVQAITVTGTGSVGRVSSRSDVALTISGALALSSSAAFAVLADSTGNFSLQAASVTLAGSSTLASAAPIRAQSLVFSSGTLVGPGLLTATSALLSTAASKTLQNGSLTFTQQAEWSDGPITVSGQARWTVQSGARFDITAAGVAVNTLPASEVLLVNNGTVRRFLRSAVAGAANVSFTVINPGTIAVLNDTLGIAGGLQSAGTVDISAGATLMITPTGAAELQHGSTLTGNGTLLVSGGQLGTSNDQAAVTVSVAGGVLVQQSAFVALGAGANLTLAGGWLWVDSGASLQTSGLFSPAPLGSGGSVRVSGAASLLLLNGSRIEALQTLQVDSAAALTVAAGARASPAVPTSGLSCSAVTVSSGGHLRMVPGSSLTVPFNVTTLTVSGGTVEFNSGANVHISAADVSAGAAVISSPADADAVTWTGGVLQGTSVLTVRQALSVSGVANKSLCALQVRLSAGGAVQGPGALQLCNGSRLWNQDSSSLQLQNVQLSQQEGNMSTVQNDNVLWASDAALLGVVLINTRNVSAAGGLVELGGFVNSTGAMYVASGVRLRLSGAAGSVITSTVQLDPGAELQYTGLGNHVVGAGPLSPPAPPVTPLPTGVLFVPATSASVSLRLLSLGSGGPGGDSGIMGAQGSLLVNNAQVTVYSNLTAGTGLRVQNGGLLYLASGSYGVVGAVPIQVDSSGALVVSGTFSHAGNRIELGAALSSSGAGGSSNSGGTAFNITGSAYVEQFAAQNITLLSGAQMNVLPGATFATAQLALDTVNATGGAFRFLVGTQSRTRLSVQQLRLQSAIASFLTQYTTELTDVLLNDGALGAHSTVNSTRLVWVAGALRGNGTLNVAQQLLVGGDTLPLSPQRAFADVAVNVAGSLLFAVTGPALSAGASIRIACSGNATLTAWPSSSTLFNSSATLTSAGSGPAFVQQGNVTLAAPAVELGLRYWLQSGVQASHVNGTVVFSGSLQQDGLYVMWPGTQASNTGSMSMTGTLSLPAGAQWTFAANAVLRGASTLSGAGTVVYTGGTFFTTGQYYVTGANYVRGGQVNWGDFFSSEVANVTVAGTVTVDNGATLKVVGAFSFVQGVFAVSTLPSVQTSIVNFDPGAAVQSLGTSLQVGAGGVFNFNSGVLGGVMGLDSVILNGGTLSVNSDDLIRVNELVISNGGTFTGNNNVVVHQVLNWYSGTMIGRGTTTVQGWLNLASSGIKYADARTTTAINTTWTGGDFRLKNNALVQNGGLWVTSTSSEMSSFSGVRSRFVNLGMLRYAAAAGSMATLSCDLINNGTVQLIGQQNGLMLLGGASFVSSGAVELFNNTLSLVPSVPFTVAAGALYGPGRVIGSMLNTGGFVYPQGVLFISNSYTQGDAGTLFLDIYGSTNGSVLDVANVVTLAGLLRVRFYFVASIGERFTVMRFRSRVNDFQFMQGCNGFLQAVYTPTSFTLVAEANPSVNSIYVAPNGSDASCCGSRVTPCRTIQFALLTVVPGYYVYLMGGSGPFTGPENTNLNLFGKNITFTADPALPPPVIDCQGSGRAFDFSHGETPGTVVANVTLQNCYSDNGGAARFLYGASPTLQRLRFINNTASGLGGAAYVDSLSQPTFQACVFSGNRAQQGGSVYIAGGNALLYDCDLSSDTASLSGGSVAVAGGSPRLEWTRMYQSRALQGGAVAALGGQPRLSGCTLQNNTATSAGGGLYVAGTATLLQMNGSSLLDNHALLDGGGLYVTQGSVLLSDSVVRGNSAQSGGGLNLNLQSSLNMSNCQLTQNTASQRGGAVYTLGSTACLLNSALWLNSATQEAGGAMYLEQSTPLLQALLIERNTAPVGGGVYAARNAVPLLVNCTLSRNSASGLGGAFYASFSSPTLTGVLLTSNQAGVSGGALFSESSSVLVDGSQLLGNTAPNGAAVYCTSASNVLLRDSNLTQNWATVYGAGLFSAASTPVLQRCRLANNSAVQGGGAYVVSSNATLSGCWLQMNNVSDQGGAVYAVASALLLQQSTLELNVAGNSGGGAQLIAATALLRSSTLSRNTANSGGALFVDSSVLQLQQCDVVRNVAVEGAGLFAVLTATTVRQGSMRQNAAQARGGGMYCLGGSGLLVQSADWDGNTAGNSGGALYTDNCSPTLQGSTFRNNSATSGGAVSCNTGAAPAVLSTAFTRNVAVLNGGALSCVTCASLLVQQSNFSGNVAQTGNGGALSVTQTSRVTVSESLMEGNMAAAGTGGALVLDASLLSVQGSTFADNQAVAGGSMSLACQSQAACNVTQSGFNGNVALGGGGGGIMWTQAPPNVVSSQSSANSAVYGSFVASAPRSLRVETRLNSSVTSGQTLSIPITVSVLDYYGQRVFTDNSTIVEVRATNASISGATSVPALQGQAVFLNLRLIGLPGSTVSLRFSADLLESAELPITFRPCTVGEEQSSILFCSLCPAATYNLNGNLTCLNCPSNADCPGGSNVTSIADYWLLYSPNSTQPDFVTPYRCPLGFCLGNNQCAPHRSGTLCATCDPNYYAWGSTCTLCESTNAPVVFVLLCGCLVYVLFVLNFSRGSSANVKIFMYFVQTLQVVLSPTSTILPASSIFNFQFDAGGGGICIAPLSFFQKSLVYVLLPLLLVVLLMLTYPLRLLWNKLQLAERLGIERCLRACRERGRRAGLNVDGELDEQAVPALARLQDEQERKAAEAQQAGASTMKDDYIHAFASLMIFSYSSITLTTLQFINCRTVGTQRLVATSPDVLCSTSEYYAWSVLYFVLLALIVIGFPLVVIVLLYRYREQLQTPLFLARFGALYRCYKPRAYWWAVVYIARRTLCIGLYVALYNSPDTRSFALAFACVFICALHIAVRPFAMSLSNLMEGISLFALALISLIEASAWATGNVNPTAPQPLIQVLVFGPGSILLLTIIFRFALPVVEALRRRAAARLNERFGAVFTRPTQDTDMTSVSNVAYLPKPPPPLPTSATNPLYSSRALRPLPPSTHSNPLFGKRGSAGDVSLNPLRGAGVGSSARLLDRRDEYAALPSASDRTDRSGASTPASYASQTSTPPVTPRNAAGTAPLLPVSPPPPPVGPTAVYMGTRTHVGTPAAQSRMLQPPPRGGQFNYDEL